MEKEPLLKKSVQSTNGKNTVLWSYCFVTLAMVPVLIAIILYHLEPLVPARLLLHEVARPPLVAPRVNSRLLDGAEFVGKGVVVGPEDFAYDPKSHVIYTACVDGWIKRVRVNDSTVENFVYVGGRPLGIALGLNNELIVADPFKGLLNVTAEGKVELLTDEVEGRKLKFADGVDVAKDGMIYFTEASYKYGFLDFIYDFYEGKAHGSVMSFDPVTRETKVLVRGLHFANGIQVSADQKSVIYCETAMIRCKRYIREGELQGTVEYFVDHLSGTPDNIRYDEEGLYWIGFSTSLKPYWDKALRYPLVRKALATITRYMGHPHMERNGGVFAVDLEGKAVAHYYDPGLTMITGGLKIGNHLYVGSLHYPGILRLNLALHDANH